MQRFLIPHITERLQKLPDEKLMVVYDFVLYLSEKEIIRPSGKPISDAFQTMLASEEVLKRDWERPEEDIAWADL